MDLYDIVIGLIFILLGVIILLIQHRIGDFKKGEKVTRNTLGLTFAGIGAILYGIYYLFTQ